MDYKCSFFALWFLCVGCDSSSDVVDCSNRIKACSVLNQKRCHNNMVQNCQADQEGCSSWMNAVVCQDDEICTQNAEQTACTKACGDCFSLGTTRCFDDRVQTCTQVEGCLRYVDTTDCSAIGQTCVLESSVARCTGDCNQCAVENTIQCSGSIIQTCSLQNECLVWLDGIDCADSQMQCREGQCEEIICQNECEQKGQSRCFDQLVQICTNDSQNCLVWADGENCAESNAACIETGSEAVCEVCQADCRVEGASRCALERIETCRDVGNNCLHWQVGTDCAQENQRCDDSGSEAQCVCQDTCPTAGQTRCDQLVLERCATDQDGCLHWLVDRDCADSDQICDESGSVAQCTCSEECPNLKNTRCVNDLIQTCLLEPGLCRRWKDGIDCSVTQQVCVDTNGQAECVSCESSCTVVGESRCNDTQIEVCTEVLVGCLQWRKSLDCADASQICDDSGAQAVCTCQDICPAQGDTRCAGDSIEECVVGQDTCLVWEQSLNCLDTGQYCDDTTQPVACRCDPQCPQVAEKRCANNVVQECQADLNGCLDWNVATDCTANGQYCQEDSGTAQCVDNGSGDSCQSAWVIQSLPFVIEGNSFNQDFSNQQNFSSTMDCTAGMGSEAVFMIHLTAGQSIKVIENGDLDAVLRIMTTCDENGACLFSRDEPEQQSFVAEAEGDYFIIVESRFEFSAAYQIGIVDGQVEQNCDNWLDDDMDGFTDCEDNSCYGLGACRVELGYCDDWEDNDDDGFEDCDDADCDIAPSCTTRKGLYQAFDSGSPNDLQGSTIRFVPDGAGIYTHEVDDQCASDWEWTPGTGTQSMQLNFGGSDVSVEYKLTTKGYVWFYGIKYHRLFIGSNGFVTFNQPHDMTSLHTADFFSWVRLAGLDVDLDPSKTGTITADEWSDRFVLTFDGVAYASGTETASFQIHFDPQGAVSIYYKYIGEPAAPYQFVGVANGAAGSVPDPIDFTSGCAG